MKTSRSGYHHGKLRTAMVDAALKRLDSGVRVYDLKLSQLAAELGVSAGAPYRHFATLESLIAEVAAIGLRRLTAAMREAAQNSTASGCEALAAIGAAYVRYAQSHPGLYEAMFFFRSSQLAAYPELAAAGSEAFSVVSDAVAEVQAKRKTAAVDRHSAAVGAWALVHGLSLLINEELIEQVDDSEKDLVERVTSLLLTGL